PDQLGAVANILARYPLYETQGLGEPFPRNINQVRQRFPLDAVGLEKELVWTAARLAARCNRLARFVRLRDELSNLLLHGDHLTALDKVSQFERELGYSLFTIQMRLITLQATSGREAQKKFLRDVYNTEGVNGYLY